MKRMSEIWPYLLSFRRIVRRQPASGLAGNPDLSHDLDSCLKSAGVTKSFGEVRLSPRLASPRVGLPSDAGYTLVETLVAMAVFVSVVIPIAASIGNMMIRSDSHVMHEALRLAQTELHRRTEEVIEGESSVDMKSFTVVSNARRNGDLFEVDVRVSSAKSSTKNLVAIHKTLLLRR